MSQTSLPVFTIGHSTHPAEMFLELLLTHGIEEVTEVLQSALSLVE